jgi:hypothetical protein
LALAGFVSRKPKNTAMRVRLSILAAIPAVLVVLLGAGNGARAAMPSDGSPAPAVPPLQSVVGGKYESFDLKAASTGHTVVLYFFPKAFTEG